VKLDDTYLEDLMSRLDHALAEQTEAEGDLELPRAESSADGDLTCLSTMNCGDDRDSLEEVRQPSLRQQIVSEKLGILDAQASAAVDPAAPPANEFCPLAPKDWDEMKISPSIAEELVLKCLMNRRTASGREIADHVAVPFGMLSHLLEQMKINRSILHRGAAQLGDYVYQLSPTGLEAAARCNSYCAYDGSVPVAFQDYCDSVSAQSIHQHPPSYEQIATIFSDLVLSDQILEQVGQALRAGCGFFLYGDSGNGKTSVAERVSRAFGQTIWIPRTLSIDGTIIRLFDPCNHVEVPLENGDAIYDQLQLDRRWVRIRRPTIIVGGELTMDRLEIRATAAAGVNEAPLQLKSNCGTLVIDDFGRQRMRADELLNRWIVPLDRRYDFLNLPDGKSIQAPFDQLLIFSTNLEPHDLADEAFLRRIPYKIRALNPTEAEFRELFRREATRQQVAYSESAIDDLIENHYIALRRPFRCCHARDLLLQIKHYCEFKGLLAEMTPERFSLAVRNYFAVMG
jgi:predicted ATPase with chaperone activity